MAEQTFEDIVDDFEFLDDWEDRYRHVIELGKAMPPMDDALKTEQTRVRGCASQVWLFPRLEGEGAAARLHFVGDSDAMIVRGLIAVLRALLSGRTPKEIAETDVMAELGRLDLDQHLSAQRSNGLRAMVTRIREVAQASAA